jgi:hypothetical protein
MPYPCIECLYMAGLCTPVHLGHRVDVKPLGLRNLSRFHNRAERDMAKFSKTVPVYLPRAQKTPITEDGFWSIAKRTHYDGFRRLAELYDEYRENERRSMALRAMSEADRHTVPVQSGMLARS